MHVKWSKTQSTGRLQASLSEGRWVDGAVRHIRIGMLATLRPADPRRLQRLSEPSSGEKQAQVSLDRFQDRLEPGQRAVLVAKLHARVPMPDGGNIVT